MDFPADMASPGMPEGQTADRFAPRQLTMEEAIGRQMDRIAYLRSMGYPWAEAVYQLRDMVVGLEDDEFYDGVPTTVRKRLEGMEKKEAEKLRGRYAADGWDTHRVRAVRGPGNQPVYRPTAENLSVELRIVMRLLTRRGIAWRTRTQSRLGDVAHGNENGAVEG